MQEAAKNIVENIFHLPSILVDEKFNIVEANDSSNELVANSALAKLFQVGAKPPDIINLEDMIKYSLNSKNISNGRINLDLAKQRQSYNYSIIPASTNENDFVLIAFSKIDNTNENQPAKFVVNNSELEKYLEDKDISAIIDKIKSSFPFTFIGKQKFQRDIDKLEFQFWLKDTDDKVLIVNKSFSVNIELNINQIIGKQFKEFFPITKRELVSSVDSFIIKTSHAAVFEFDAGSREKYLQIPLLDLDGNTAAIIGFSLPASETISKEIAGAESYGIKIGEVSNELFAMMNSDMQLFEISNALCKLLNINPDEAIGKTVDEIFPESVYNMLSGFKTQPESELKEGKIYLGISGESNFFISIKKIIKDEKLQGFFLSLNENKSINQESELKVKMYDIIMHTSPEAMFIYDIESLKFLEVNNAALRLYGYNRDEFLEMDLTDLYAPEDIQTLIDSSPSKTAYSEFTGPWRHKHKKGKTILVEISKTTMEFSGHKAHFNIVRDVTERVEDRLKSQRLSAVYESSRDLIFQTDKDGFILNANKYAFNYLGLDINSIQNKPLISLAADSERAKINSEIFHKNLKSTYSAKTKIKKSDGSIIDCEIIATPILNYDNALDSFNIIIKPKQDAEKIIVEKEAPQPISTSSQLDASFLSNLFHELLTPINVMMGFTQEIVESLPSPTNDQKESIGIIKENQKLLLQIVDNAVEFSNIEQKKYELNPENILFVKILEEVESNVQKDLKDKQTDFNYGRISSSLKLETDKSKLSNLLTLLIRFSSSSTPHKKIFLSAYPHGSDSCIISVKDERNSVSREMVNNLAEIFEGDENIVKQKFAISRFTTRLAKRLVKILGGKIEIQKKDGELLEYAIILPVKFLHPAIAEEVKETKDIEKFDDLAKVKVHEPIITEQIKTPTPAPIYSDAQSQSINVNVNLQPARTEKEDGTVIRVVTKEKEPPLNAVTKETVDSSGPKELHELNCLYVEDQIDSQILFKVQMKELKLVEFAISFEKALPLLQARKYDFIVMDINLQGEYNGLDALRAIQKMPEYRNIPVIAVTAYVLPGDREKFIAAGFVDFITKPILKDKLEAVIKKIFV